MLNTLFIEQSILHAFLSIHFLAIFCQSKYYRQFTPVKFIETAARDVACLLVRVKFVETFPVNSDNYFLCEHKILKAWTKAPDKHGL